ncbi:hypothetical protein SAMN05446037_105215 [Anaerovirgula multivorans]|uniref:G5 domain-containing protein n=1 Tax=Anaerovirgula multivorans TaxID=312168 RepID=A0A239KRR6_9FIRM|nr:hypothetical protein [Anaerovirgula multivorans]SNT20730.1 hypothetical protein SAMN05446037_105215 [Anaerovirgula multivorans]
MINRFKRFNAYLILAICFTMVLSSGISFAQSIDEEFNDEFNLEDICGGIKIIDGNSYVMTKEEAQAEYLKEKKLEKNITVIENDEDEITTQVIVGTEIKKTTTLNGENVRISRIEHNETQDPIEKTVSGSKTYTATGLASASLKLVADKVNASTSYSVSTSSTISDSTKITIQPGKRFYITFTPKMLKVEGRQLHSLGKGMSKWEDFTTEFPRVLDNGITDGNIYYITK